MKKKQHEESHRFSVIVCTALNCLQNEIEELIQDRPIPRAGNFNSKIKTIVDHLHQVQIVINRKIDKIAGITE